LIVQAVGTPYKEEAQVAYTMAQKILLENGLTMSEVDALTADEQRKLAANEGMTTMGKRHVDWLLRLARIIARNFRVRHYVYHNGWGKYQTHHIRMVGLADDVTVARDVYASARAVAERLATAYAKEPGVLLGHLCQTRGAVSLSEVNAADKAAATRQIKGIWLEGFLDGLEARFAEQVKASASMAPSRSPRRRRPRITPRDNGLEASSCCCKLLGMRQDHPVACRTDMTPYRAADRCVARQKGGRA
jgi:hypothetical protein